VGLYFRISLALFLVYHFYLYSQPAGFHLLALLVMFLFLFWLMLFCVRNFELEAYNLGYVSIDQPRAFYNSLPWPGWHVALAPDFTLFMPVAHESTSLYNMPVGAAPGVAGPMAPMPIPLAPQGSSINSSSAAAGGVSASSGATAPLVSSAAQQGQYQTVDIENPLTANLTASNTSSRTGKRFSNKLIC
jgi:hypothetical protein